MSRLTLCCLYKVSQTNLSHHNQKTKSKHSERHICFAPFLSLHCIAFHTHQYQHFPPSIHRSSAGCITSKLKFRFQMIFLLLLLLYFSSTFAFVQCSYCMSCDTYFSFFLFVMNVIAMVVVS